jgi:hypothetical protein
MTPRVGPSDRIGRTRPEPALMGLRAQVDFSLDNCRQSSTSPETVFPVKF